MLKILMFVLFLIIYIQPIYSAIENPEYPIVVGQYARSVNTNSGLPDFGRPYSTPSNIKLVILKTDGTKEDLYVPPAGLSAVDHIVSPDGKWVYFSLLKPHDSASASILRINIETKIVEVVVDQGPGAISTGPCLTADGEEMIYTELNRGGSWRAMDILQHCRTVVKKINFKTKKMETLLSGPQHFLHPVLCPNGQIAIAWVENNGTHDSAGRRWAVGYFNQDGTGLTSVFPGMERGQNGWHGHCVVPSKKDMSGNEIYRGGLMTAERYYNVNNAFYGTFYRSSFHPLHEGEVAVGQPNNFLPFAPKDMFWLTTFETTEGDTISKQVKGFAFGPDGWSVSPTTTEFVGKVSQPSAFPASLNIALWSPGPVNFRAGRQNFPSPWGHVILFDPSVDVPYDHPSKFRIIGKPAENEGYLTPKPVVDIKTLFGEVPPKFVSKLVPDIDYAVFGTSSMNNAEVRPKNKSADQFKLDSNYNFQGASKYGYKDEEMYAVEFYEVARGGGWTEKGMEITTNNTYKSREYFVGRLLLNSDFNVVGPDGLRDTSWAAKVRAKVPMVIKVTNVKTQAIINSLFVHFFQPGEIATGCNGCHNHNKPAHHFDLSAAGKAWKESFTVNADFTQSVPKIYSFEKDVKPILTTRCVGCHDSTGSSGKPVNWGDINHVKALCKNQQSWNSILSQRICANDELGRMPKDADPLPQSEIDVINRWIDSGMASRQIINDKTGDPFEMNLIEYFNKPQTPRVAIPEVAGGFIVVIPDPEPEPDPEPNPEPDPEPETPVKMTHEELLNAINRSKDSLVELLNEITRRGIE